MPGSAAVLGVAGGGTVPAGGVAGVAGVVAGPTWVGAGASFCCIEVAAPLPGCATVGDSAVPDPEVTDGDDVWHATTNTRTQDFANIPVFPTGQDLTQGVISSDNASRPVSATVLLWELQDIDEDCRCRSM